MVSTDRPWIGEIDVTPETARDLIRTQFPSLAAGTVSMLGRGWDNIAMLVDDDLVFRFPIRAVAAALIETEVRVLPSLAPMLPLRIPVPEWIGAPTESCPWGFAGYRRIPGRSACSARFTKEARTRLAPRLAEFLAQLHAIPVADFDLPGDLFARSDFTRRLPLLRESLDGIRSNGLIPSPDPWLRLFDSLDHAPPPVRRTIVHGDLYARHILTDDSERPTGIIDWGDIHAEDPAIDLMVMYEFLPAAARPAFERAYGDIHDEERRIARLRAAFHAVVLTWYGIEKPDDDIAREGRRALDFVLED